MGWLSGWKTYAAAAIAAFVAANGILKWVPPETEATILAIAAALGLWGLRYSTGRIEGQVKSLDALQYRAAQIEHRLKSLEK